MLNAIAMLNLHNLAATQMGGYTGSRLRFPRKLGGIFDTPYLEFLPSPRKWLATPVQDLSPPTKWLADDEKSKLIFVIYKWLA